MGYFDDNTKVGFDDLERCGNYSLEILQKAKEGNYDELSKLLNNEIRKDIDYMEPLLYAVKNEKNTYIIYQYYDPKLQNSVSLASDIIIGEPELIKDTPVSRNKDFIYDAAQVNPRVVQYMDEELARDVEFVEKICGIPNKEITKCVGLVCGTLGINIEDSELKDNATFMLGAILHDVTALKNASEELKNNYEFMKEACTNNSNVIEYVVEHTEDFGKEALSATKDVVIDESSNNAILGFEQMRDEIQGQMHDAEGNDLEKLVKKDKQLLRHIDFFKRVQNREVNPVRAAKLIDKLCINIDGNLKQQLMIVLKLDEAIQEKEQEIMVTQGDVEEKTFTEGATVGEMNAETNSIRHVIGNTKGKGTDDKIKDGKEDI